MPPPATYVIVPAYQEGQVIRETLRGLVEAGYAVILVDDGSTDDTAQAIAGLPIWYLRHPINLGQGAALATGMAMARRLAAEYVVHFDADGQHRVADIPALLAPLLAGEADISLGSRFLDPAARAAIPAGRRRLLRLAIWVNYAFTGLRLSDAHCGLRALNARALAAIDLRSPGMAHATEILSHIRQQELRWQEVPVHIAYSPYARQKGQSSAQAIGILGDLIFRKIFPR